MHILIRTEALEIIYAIFSRLAKVTNVRLMKAEDLNRDEVIALILEQASLTIVDKEECDESGFDIVINAQQAPFFKAVQVKPYDPNFHAINRGTLVEYLKAKFEPIPEAVE